MQPCKGRADMTGREFSVARALRTLEREERHVHEPVAPGMCVLCEAPAQGTGLSFRHRRQTKRVGLEVAFCETCGTKAEKHLLRLVPRRRFKIETKRP
jgi:hypothetical protein